MRTPHRPTRLLALLLALLLPLAAACGGDDSSDDSSDGGSDTEQEAPSSPDDDGDTSSETSEADDSSGGPEEDALTAAIEAQADALGIEDVIEEDDAVTLVMADGTDADGAQAACAFGAQVNPDATVSVDVDGEVTPCP